MKRIVFSLYAVAAVALGIFALVSPTGALDFIAWAMANPLPAAGLAIVPALGELQQYNVNRPDQVEAIRSSLYDKITFVDNSSTELQFFQIPQGQSSKTLADTNMEAAGMLPAPKSFLVQTIEIYAFPANGIAATGTTIAEARNLEDMYDVFSVGWLEFFIGSKLYLQEGPLMKFPPRSGLTGMQFGTDSTANSGVRVDYVSLGGPVYEVDPWILLVPTQNFRVSLKWAAAVNINSNMPILVNLGGVLYRNSQ